ncbi:MAG: IclR family transcriptional regulator [Planctomycetota bacterium]
MESTVLTKAFAILESLASAREPVSLAELTQRLLLNKPTIHRILQDLIGLGYVESRGGGLYVITNKLQRLSYGRDTAMLIEVAEPILTRLHEKTEETVNLGILQQATINYLMVLESPQALRRVESAGGTDPFHSTALGRAIVSHLPESRWERLIRGAALKRQTPNTIVNHDQLEATLRESRQRGFADEWEENDVGVMCVAVPILVNDEPVAAVSLTVPMARMNRNRERELVAELQETTRQLGKALS